MQIPPRPTEPMQRLLTRLAIGLTFSLIAIPSWRTLAADPPNILIVMVDDLGYSDLGCYGSEIETPNLDRLAMDGIRFSQFYNTAKCHSSRISLLTGCYAFQAGNTKMNRAVTSAEVLAAAGYSTMMTGKWHLDGQPTDFGFDRYFGHLSGACNYFSGDKTFRLDGQPWKVPAKGFYTTVANVDFALKFLNDARPAKQPWYLYVAFNAPHAPLHAMEQDYRKYENRYEVGWDQIREQRVARQRELGLLEEDESSSPRPDHLPAWDTLSSARRTFEMHRMAALAAMIDRVDQEMGRLLEDLESNDELDNTLIWFVSDNGACPYDRVSRKLTDAPTRAEVSWSDSTGWAWARDAPFRFYKQNQYEGGIATPAIVHWPNGLKTERGVINDQPAHLIDVLPTLADVCDAQIPTTWPDRDLKEVSGISLAPLFRGQTLKSRPPIHFIFGSDRGFRDGDWKLVSFRSGPWELYDLSSDPTELNDVASQHPERLAAMVKQWTTMTRDVLEAPRKASAPVGDTSKPKRHPQWTNFEFDPVDGRPGYRARR